MREVSLDGKHVGQIAIVIFCPNVLVVVGVDQLHVDTHPIADPAHAAFQKCGNAERFADFTSVARATAAIGHD